MTKKKNVSQEYSEARHAITFKSPERMSILTSLKDINEQDKDGETLLWEDVHMNDLDVVKYLLENGANPNTQEKEGWTPLHLCAQNYSVECARLLLDYGADCEIKNVYGNNVINTAAFYSRNRGEIIRLLLAHGANPRNKNNNGISALDLAEMIANYDVKQFFMDYL